MAVTAISTSIVHRLSAAPKIRSCTYLESVPRIVFSDDADLLAVRFARSPVWETHLAVRTFVDERSRLFHLPWHRAVRKAAARLDLGPLLATNPPSGFVPDFLTPPPSHSAPTLAEQLGQIRATPVQPGEGGARALPRLERRWFLQGDAGIPRRGSSSCPRAAGRANGGSLGRSRGAVLAPHRGVDRGRYRLSLTSARHPRPASHPRRPPSGIRWADGAVEVDGPGDAEVDLAGRGLVLMPSAYAWPVVTAIVDGPWQPTVIYPARGVAAALGGTDPTSSRARAAARTDARAPTRQPRPPDLDNRARGAPRRSTSGVSGHLLALRDAGLVSASRRGHELRYGRTRLGACPASGFEGRLTPFSSPETLARAARRARAREARSRARRRPRRAARTRLPRARRCGR